MSSPCSIRSALLLCVSLLPVKLSFAMERIVLSNGFSVDCHHRVPVENGRVRLFLTRDESSYVDVDVTRIHSSELLDQSPVTDKTPDPVSVRTPEIAERTKSVDTMIAEQGGVHRLNVDLLNSLVQAESGGRVHAVSRTGARGLMQLMPATAANLGVADSFAPDQNLQGGTTYLDQMLVRYHDNLALALAAYNAGPGAVDRYHGVPPYRETQAYVARIIREFNRRSLQARRSSAALVKLSR